MEEKHKIFQLLIPIAEMCLEKKEIEMFETIQSDVELMLLTLVELWKSKRFEECVETAETVIDMTWEDLNTGHWSLVPEEQRRVYAAASLIKVVALVQKASHVASECIVPCLEQAVKAADMGLLLGNSYREQLTTAASLLSQALNQYGPKDVNFTFESENSSTAPPLKVPSEPVPQLQCPSLETFSAQHFYPQLPVKISGCMRHWKALQRWTDLSYLLEKAGSRTVPVELGSSYSDNEWSQRLMSLRNFVSQHVTHCSEGSKGYLAQHQLFDQIPELRQDIAVPEYCACSETDSETPDVDINAWFGPAGTISPLHYDPKHNLLCQVVGRKRVTLYSPDCSDCLYPHEGRLLSNTATVDPEAPDYKRHPKYQTCQALYCLLSPGEMLYIPPNWWHHVRSLDTSFSVSFWWK